MKAISRRDAIGLIAAASTSLTTAAVAAPSATPSCGPDALAELFEQQKEANAADRLAWNLAADLEESPIIDAAPCVRVQTWFLYKGRDDEGNDIREPQYSYSEEDIRSVFKRHFEPQLSMLPDNERFRPAREKLRANYEARSQAKVNELAALKAARDQAEHDSGLTAALQQARAASAVVKDIEAQILAYAFTSLEDVRRISAWLLDQTDETSYLDEDAYKNFVERLAGRRSAA